VALERRNDVFRTEQDCLRLVEEAKAEATDTVELALKATIDSEAKCHRLITSMQKQLAKKIAFITHRANKNIESSKMDVERLQQECHMKATAASEAERTILKINSDHARELSSLSSQHKIALRDTQARHVLRFEKQKQSMTNEMNRLRELLYGQNEMIDGCLDEMKDERRAARLASDSAKQLKVIASDRMDKIKWWKGKCDELTRLKDAYVTQATKMEEMQQRIDEYERLSEEMTEDYEETILSMCPRHIEKARVRNLTNKYGHQEWKPFVDKLIIEFLCDRVPPTCIQLVMVAMSKGKSVTCMSIMLSIND
jgi:hypothetical protein